MTRVTVTIESDNPVAIGAFLVEGEANVEYDSLGDIEISAESAADAELVSKCKGEYVKWLDS